MSIKNIAVGGVNTAFKVLKEFVQTVTFTEISSEYNATTGVQTDPTSFTCSTLFGNYIEKDSGIIQRGDRELFVKIADVTAANSGNVLRTDMKITETSGTVWVIISITADPTDTLYTCIIRRSR